MIDLISNDYSNKKGIYKDLYREIEAENKKKTAVVSRQRKGIYKDLYRQLEEDKKNIEFEAKKKEKTNLWHQYPLKWLVYTNDVGEAMKPIIGALYAKLSWIPSIIYTIFALFGKSFKSKNEQNNLGREILFQLFASFLLPILLLKSTRKIANKLIDKTSLKTKEMIKNSVKQIGWINNLAGKFKKETSSGYRNLGLSAMGLITLAIAVKPIDNLVNNTLDRIYNHKGYI